MTRTNANGEGHLTVLNALLVGDASRSVAYSQEGMHTQADLRDAAARVHASILPGSRHLLACEDPFAFLATLLGLAAAGCTAVLPPNHLLATLETLATEVDGVLTALPTSPITAPLPPLQDIDLVFWTSGSSGQPKAVVRKLSHLTLEVVVLEALFGSHFQEGPVLGTVPHHHIYGCLFRVLWPWMTGRPFAAETTGHPDHFVQEHGALVSSPAHLSRMLRLVDFATIAHPLAAVFSSGGPLSREDALAWGRWVKDGVVEVYGSTESGGIAWRIQDEDPESRCWRPFPDIAVALEADGALRIHTPRVEGGTLRMEDRAALRPDGRFELLGRLDRVVKVEEKRVSLPELETALESIPDVRRAAVVVLEGPRRALGAVLAMDAPPAAAAERRALAAKLRSHLAQRFDAVLLPRRWRFVQELPTDNRGKLPQEALLALFAQADR